jgi:hypothetical protein
MSSSHQNLKVSRQEITLHYNTRHIETNITLNNKSVILYIYHMYDTYNTIIPNIDEHKINNQLIDVRNVTALYQLSVNFDILYKYSM